MENQIVEFAGEGEWQITLEVFRDLGLAFGAALTAIYILRVAQTGSFVIPGIVMLAIPLSILGIMPGFWLLNAVAGGSHAGHDDAADGVVLVAEQFDGALAACADRSHRRVPAEIGYVQPMSETGGEQILPLIHGIRLVIDNYDRHRSRPESSVVPTSYSKDIALS
jgi:hypothetical protein